MCICLKRNEDEKATDLIVSKAIVFSFPGRAAAETLEPLLHVMEGEPHPAPAGARASGGGDGDGDDTEPLPGDMHYPWLERHLQHIYRQHVSCNQMASCFLLCNGCMGHMGAA
jgi:hypothetical protein